MQQQKNRMTQKTFRIGELAKKLKIKKFVIRFWEKEFGLQADRSQGGQRSYSHDDLQTFRHIKNLLYEQGYTISGAKNNLKRLLKPAEQTLWTKEQKLPLEVREKIAIIKQKLVQFKQLLD